MNDEERKELEELQSRCIDKRTNKPKKSAEMADLERMSDLLAMDDAVEIRPEKLEPLTPDEEERLAVLNRRANEGRSQLQPTPPEMLELSRLRARKKANL